MTVQSNYSSIRGVPLKHLFLSPLNVRKDDSDKGILELADSIEAEGVLQNLIGHEGPPMIRKHPKAKSIGVVGGGRRWRALQLLLEKRKINSEYIVPVFVTSEDAAIAISLAENSDREPLHPADEFEAARALVYAGHPIGDVAAKSRLTPLTVQRRLKLANVAPEFVQLYRQGKITLEHLLC
jgi:ParB family chromosome partitioning protein